MPQQSIGVVVLGSGTIGGEVARRIASGNASVPASGLNLVLKGVLARSPASLERAGIDPDLFINDPAAAVIASDVDVVVEVLGGEDPAANLMIQSLSAGKHVVTANKEAVAKNFATLVSAANEGDAALLYEASVGGGIPLMTSLRQVLSNNTVTSIRGIVNGTTNYILHRMEAEGADYADALAGAQELGYAEPDPTADVEGFDAAYKLAILASLMTGEHVQPDQVDRTGISGVSLDDVREAINRGGTIRLIAEARRDESGELSLSVAPVFVDAADLFSKVVANYNAIEVTGDNVGSVWLHGQGAGPAPTASAIIGDIVQAVQQGHSATVGPVR